MEDAKPQLQTQQRFSRWARDSWGAGSSHRAMCSKTWPNPEPQSMRGEAQGEQLPQAGCEPCHALHSASTPACVHTRLSRIQQLVILQTAGAVQLRCDTYNYS